MNSILRTTGVAIAAIVLSSGCLRKGQSGIGNSEVKTIDNLTRPDGSALSINNCGPAEIPKKLNDQKYRSKVKGSFQDLVLKTLGAAPAPILNSFFDYGGRIEVRSDARQLCAASDLPDATGIGENSEEISSCWIKKSGETPVIYVVNDAAKIRHNILRSLAYYYTGIVAESLKETYPVQVHSFESKVSTLATSFMNVLKADKGAAYQRMAAIKAKSNKIFERIVFAEMIDSVYCNSETYLSVAKTSSKYAPVFKDFADKSKTGSSLALELGEPWHRPKHK